MDSSYFDLVILAQGGTSAASALQTGGAAPAATGTTAAPGTTPVGGPGPQTQPSMWPILMPFVLVIGAMMLFQMLGARKERKKRDDLMRNLKRGDKVLTIGGIIGTIDQVRDDEIMVKVDPNSNAKIAFTRNAIQQVLNASTPSATDSAAGNGTVEVKAKADKVGASR